MVIAQQVFAHVSQTADPALNPFPNLEYILQNRRVVMASKTEKKPTWTAVAIYVQSALLERIVCRMMTAYRKFVMLLMGFASVS